MNGYNLPGGCPPNLTEFDFTDDGYRPFRKRHPLLFTFIALGLTGILGLLAFSCIRGLLDGEALGSFTGKQLGVLNIEGVILDSADIVDWAGKLEENDNVVGVLVRIDSPGGAVTPSEEIYFAIKRIAAKKPVVVSMGTLAASGGYMAALPATHIMASPSSITGSIGTRMDMANWGGLLDKIGIKDQSLASGAMKDAGSPYRDLKEDERAYFMGMLTDMHEQFKSMVIEHRGLEQGVVNKIADGRAYTGRQALALGLVDSLGDKYDALVLLNALSGNAAAGSIMLEGPPEDYSFLEKMFESMFRAWNHAQINAAYERPVFYF